jgi:hypothetical protein
MRSRGVVKQKKRFLIVLIYIFFGWKTRQWWCTGWDGKKPNGFHRGVSILRPKLLGRVPYRLSYNPPLVK